MDTPFYLELFQNAANQIDKNVLAGKQLEVATGLYGDSVFLKLYKKSWAGPSADPLTAKTRIFFSIWISDSDIAQQKLFYNIHAFKLRLLKGYKIESRKFADSFRVSFLEFERQWPNVNVHYGPLTLMQGWIAYDPDKMQEEIIKLSNNFLELEPLIDQTLAKFKA
ncbi:hypothetical protein [Mucilaginibacter sp.]|uniref:hypothetical protein n=1 Tax=Mucilaginibacter sp. TaxID=1882438 RepID=UPI003D0CD46D